MSYSHVVVVMPDKNNAWVVRAKDTKGAAVDVTVKARQREFNAQHEEDVVGKMEAYYTTSKKNAEFFAKVMASRFPGKQIAVFEAKGIFEGQPGEVVAKEISEKGILPV